MFYVKRMLNFCVVELERSGSVLDFMTFIFAIHVPFNENASLMCVADVYS